LCLSCFDRHEHDGMGHVICLICTPGCDEIFNFTGTERIEINVYLFENASDNKRQNSRKK